MPCAVGATDNPRNPNGTKRIDKNVACEGQPNCNRRQVLGARDEFDIEDDRPVRSPGTATSSSAREGALPERRRNIRTPPRVLAVAQRWVVLGPMALQEQPVVPPQERHWALQAEPLPERRWPQRIPMLLLQELVLQDYELVQENRIGAAAGVVAVLNRVQIRDQYAQWPPPPVVPQFADRPAMVRDDTPPPPESKEADTAKSGEVVQETPPSTSSTPESHKSDEHKTGQAHRQPWKRASAVSLRRANNMLSAEIEAKSGEVVAKGLDDLGILLSQLQQLQAACQAAIAQATEKTIQRARSLGLKAKARDDVDDG
eukprot:g11662.t1